MLQTPVMARNHNVGAASQCPKILAELGQGGGIAVTISGGMPGRVNVRSCSIWPIGGMRLERRHPDSGRGLVPCDQ
jgi:hypothetical protein